jgi:hypothetical protein
MLTSGSDLLPQVFRLYTRRNGMESRNTDKQIVVGSTDRGLWVVTTASTAAELDDPEGTATRDGGK